MRSDSSSSITGYGGARPKQHSRSTGSKRSSFCSEGDGGGVGYPGGNQVNKTAFTKIKFTIKFRGLPFMTSAKFSVF